MLQINLRKHNTKLMPLVADLLDNFLLDVFRKLNPRTRDQLGMRYDFRTWEFLEAAVKEAINDLREE